MKQLAVLLFAVLATACSAPFSQTAVTPSAPRPAMTSDARSSPSPIQHVIVIMQENRSFDNFFHGFPKASSATFGWGHGVKYPLQALPLKWTHDMNHYHIQFLEDYDKGKNDGWNDQIYGFQTGSGCSDPRNHPACWIFVPGKTYQKMAFSYVLKSDIQPYWTMASQYALGDHNFTSNNGPSFGAHQYLIAGQEGHAAEVPSAMPWGCDAPKETLYYLQYGAANPPEFPPAVGHEVLGGDPCFTYPSVADLLDAKGITWRYYVQPAQQDGYWLSAFDAISAVRNGPDWKNVVSPDTAVLNDIAGANLAQVSWVMPHGGASDHAGGGSGAGGPDWVASIVNAIGESAYWKNTAIIITWDEWGGWFDHVVPPQYADPVTGAYEGLGYRTPLIVVSPYARAHYVSKQQHETASSLHFIEKTFGLGTLGLADARADAYNDIFDFSQKPIAFKPIPTKLGPQYFIAHPATEPEIDY
ncbi:MAG: alkaline phosphatase family protein [Candidatus Tumulicola sp.]